MTKVARRIMPHGCVWPLHTTQRNNYTADVRYFNMAKVKTADQNRFEVHEGPCLLHRLPCTPCAFSKALASSHQHRHLHQAAAPKNIVRAHPKDQPVACLSC